MKLKLTNYLSKETGDYDYINVKDVEKVEGDAFGAVVVHLKNGEKQYCMFAEVVNDSECNGNK